MRFQFFSDKQSFNDDKLGPAVTINVDIYIFISAESAPVIVLRSSRFISGFELICIMLSNLLKNTDIIKN
ncbi:hypothetical protein LBMAG25_03750 [Bacteroidota bacterium]|jgi:hypothetical protein|nr:hypothetical protein LBMAG25_03750 [Bacteroidota bacterium]